MTRGEAINKAAVQYATHLVDTDETDFYGKSIQVIDLDRAEHRGFVHGAKWADDNPNSPWIDVEDDLPCDHEEMYKMAGSLLYTEEVLVLAGNALVAGRKLVICMLFDDKTGKWKWDTQFHVKYWMRIPKSPK